VPPHWDSGTWANPSTRYHWAQGVHWESATLAFDQATAAWRLIGQLVQYQRLIHKRDQHVEHGELVEILAVPDQGG
jgi:hypothetical protein